MKNNIGSKNWQKAMSKALNSPKFKFKPSKLCIDNRLDSSERYTPSERERIKAAQAFILTTLQGAM